MIAKIRTGFSTAQYSDDALETKAMAIHTAITDNPNFPTPNPAMPALLTAINDFSLALVEAQSGDKIKKAFKNAKRQALVQLLKTLGNYVTMTAGTNEAMLASSGFTMAKTPVPIPPITVPQKFVLQNGLGNGQIVASVNKVKGARCYLFQHKLSTAPPTDDYNSIPCVERKFVFNGLQAGQTYQFRVAVIGVNQQIVYTEPQLRMAV